MSKYTLYRDRRKAAGLCLTCPAPLNGNSMKCSACYRKSNLSIGRSAKQLVQSAKSTPCTDCGIQYPPWVMQFDHIRGTKEFNVSVCGGDNISLVKLRAEIAKCEVVCANCHAHRTYVRQQLEK